MCIRDRNNIALAKILVESEGSIELIIEPVSYTHLDVYKRQSQLPEKLKK